eukprot:755468-Pelagomonas_calceolata.AAC.6
MPAGEGEGVWEDGVGDTEKQSLHMLEMSGLISNRQAAQGVRPQTRSHTTAACTNAASAGQASRPACTATQAAKAVPAEAAAAVAARKTAVKKRAARKLLMAAAGRGAAEREAVKRVAGMRNRRCKQGGLQGGTSIERLIFQSYLLRSGRVERTAPHQNRTVNLNWAPLVLGCGLNYQQASKLTQTPCTFMHIMWCAYKLVTTRRVIENKNGPHSLVLEPGASGNPPVPHWLAFLFVVEETCVSFSQRLSFSLSDVGRVSSAYFVYFSLSCMEQLAKGWPKLDCWKSELEWIQVLLGQTLLFCYHGP